MSRTSSEPVLIGWSIAAKLKIYRWKIFGKKSRKHFTTFLFTNTENSGKEKQPETKWQRGPTRGRGRGGEERERNLHKVILHDVSNNPVIIKITSSSVSSKWFLLSYGDTRERKRRKRGRRGRGRSRITHLQISSGEQKIERNNDNQRRQKPLIQIKQ
tara:strand:+ start:764 stop:1237 length:474 start_codon:yes stop_codon:yes gene_type:complete